MVESKVGTGAFERIQAHRDEQDRLDREKRKGLLSNQEFRLNEEFRKISRGFEEVREILVPDFEDIIATDPQFSHPEVHFKPIIRVFKPEIINPENVFDAEITEGQIALLWGDIKLGRNQQAGKTRLIKTYREIKASLENKKLSPKKRENLNDQLNDIGLERLHTEGIKIISANIFLEKKDDHEVPVVELSPEINSEKHTTYTIENVKLHALIPGLSARLQGFHGLLELNMSLKSFIEHRNNPSLLPEGPFLNRYLNARDF